MAKELDDVVESFRNRPLDQGPSRFVWADALVVNVREGGRVVGVHVLIATGVNAKSHREILGCEVSSAETGWLAFLRGLVPGGFRGCAWSPPTPTLGLSGPSAPRCQGPPGSGAGPTTWGTCSPKSPPYVATLVRTVFDQPDATEVHAQFDRVVQALEAKLPEAAAHLEEAREDLLAFSCFPREIWRQVWSSNPQERLNREIRRRTDVVGIFPDRHSIIRLIGAVLMEQTDEWTESRRSMGIEVLAKVDQALAAPAGAEHEASLELPEAAMA